MPTTYDVFLSYNSVNKREVERIAVRLRDEQGLRLFFDEWELVPGDSVIPVLEQAIDQSQTVAVFLGPNGMGPWQEEERQVALVYAVKSKRRVIPALLPGAREQGVPGFLGTKAWVDLAEDEGFARLVAGIAGRAPGQLGGQGAGPQSDAFAKVRREVIDFATERNRHKHFFGREDVLGEMDAWVSERDGGWLVITGSPGLGKSALMDRWLRRREAAGLRTAFHFIRRGHLDWAEPQVVQRNIAAQIELMFPEQRDTEADPTYRLEQLLERVSFVLADRNERLVLLVDGLDEAMEPGGADPVPKMFPLEVPAQVFVVVASRPQYPHLGYFGLRTGPSGQLDLDGQAASNEDAVRAYWTTLGPSMKPALSPELLRAAVEGAQGNLLHAVKLRDLWSDPKAKRSPKDVPHGFRGMVDKLWDVTRPRVTDDPARDKVRARTREGVALLCAARESLPLHVLEELLGWKEGEAKAVFLPLAREMLHEDPWHDLPVYRPFHEALRDLVVKEARQSMTVCWDKLAGYASWPIEGDDFRRGYALRHRVEHLLDSGRLDEASGTVMDLGYLKAKACAEGLVAVERNIRLATEARKDDQGRRHLTTLGRLVAASAHWASEVPEALPALLHDRALTNAPELLEGLLDPSRLSVEHPRLRHPVQIGGMPRILQGHRGWVNALAVLPNGRVVSGSVDKTLRVWDIATGRILSTLEGHQGGVNALAVLPNGRVVSGSFDKTLRVWDVAMGRTLATLQGHVGRVNALAVLPDGRVVSGSDDTTLRVWDVQSGRTLATLRGHTDSVRALAVLPDGRVVSGSSDTTLRVWDAATGRTLITLQGHTDSVIALAVLPDGRVVSGSDDTTLRVWDITTGRTLITLQGHTSWVYALAVLPDGRVISGSHDNTLRVWDVPTGRTLATLQGHASWVMALAVLPDGRVVSGSSDDTLRVWDIATGRTLATFQGHTSWVMALAVLPDGRVVSGSSDDTLRVWDIATGRTLATLQGHMSYVMALAVLPDGRVVSGSDDTALRVWDVATGRTLATLQGHASRVNTLAVLPDGRVVSGSSDNTLRVWDITTGRTLATLQGHTNYVMTLAVLPNGRVVSGSSDDTLRVWDIATGRTLATLQGHMSYVMALAVLSDGRVVSGSYDTTLRVWDIATGRTLATLQGHASNVHALAVLPDGRVVSGSSDNTLRVWDVATGRILTTVYGDVPFRSVACVDQHLIVAGDAVGNVWFIDLPDLSRTR